MRFTLDSNILVRAVVSPSGPALRLLDAVLGAHTLVLSRFILDEVERALLYPRIQSRYQITAAEAARFAGTLADVSLLVEPVIARPLVLFDPADDPVLYTAAGGKADVLCTRNTRHFASQEVQGFCIAHGIRVMTDLEALGEFFKRGDRSGSLIEYLWGQPILAAAAFQAAYPGCVAYSNPRMILKPGSVSNTR